MEYKVKFCEICNRKLENENQVAVLVMKPSQISMLNGKRETRIPICSKCMRLVQEKMLITLQRLKTTNGEKEQEWKYTGRLKKLNNVSLTATEWSDMIGLNKADFLKSAIKIGLNKTIERYYVKANLEEERKKKNDDFWKSFEKNYLGKDVRDLSGAEIYRSR